MAQRIAWHLWGMGLVTLAGDTLAEENQAAPGTVTLPSVTVEAAGATDGYVAYSATTATKTDTPLIETPVSVQVVPRDVIEDQQATRLTEALENVSGVLPQSSIGRGSGFLVRGFQQGRIYRDGLIANGVNSSFPTEYDSATIDSVEVLKGPASVLYGRTEPGGLINITSKRPLATPHNTASIGLGSFGFQRAELDSTGPVTADGELLYRIVGAWQDSDTFRDFGQDDRRLVAPSLTWRPSDDTRLTTSFEHFEQEHQADYGIPVLGNRPVRLPVERSYGDPNDPLDHERNSQFGTDIYHRLNDTWAIQHRFLYGDLHGDTTFINPAPAFGNAIRADGRTMDRNIFKQSNDQEIYATNLDLTGTIGQGAIRHNLVFGMDYTHGQTLYPIFGNYKTPNPALAIDIFNPGPSYGIDTALFPATLATGASPTNYSVFKDELYGVYAQDQIDLGEKLHVLIGGRYDQAKTGRGRGTTESTAEDNLPAPLREDSAFSPRLGVLYELMPILGIYASWSQSFGANNGVSASGKTFDPEKGNQYEIGLKAELFDHRLMANLALFELTKTNLLTPDLSTPDSDDSIAIGKQRSRGVELDLAGQVTEAVSLIASYAYTDAKISEDNGGLQGSLLANVPRQALSLWGKYTFLDATSLQGLTLGLGSIAQDQREGDIANSFQLPGFVRMDAMAAYPFALGGQQLTAQFNVRNLFDTLYYESTDPDSNVAPRLGVYVGEPRTFIASLKLEF